jgi:thiamine-phosphate pyrophosphorylase
VTDFSRRVIALSDAAWRLRENAPAPCGLSFALALFSDPQRLPPIEVLAGNLPRDIPPIAVIFRHDTLEAEERRMLAKQVCGLVQERGHLFLMAREELDGADGAHGAGPGPGIRTAPCHDIEELIGLSAWADAAFLSPLHATGSHPGRHPLTRRTAVSLAQASRVPLFALGGMNEVTAMAFQGTPFYGMGAIEAFVSEPERA